LILTNVNTFADGEFRNNFVKRAITFNPDGQLTGARHIALAGVHAYIVTNDALVIVDLTMPIAPRLLAAMPFEDPRAVAIQFRYAFVTDVRGLHVVDVTHPANPQLRLGSVLPLRDARKLTVSRTYAYVANGRDGLAIVDIEKPTTPRLYAHWGAGSELTDARDIVIASTNASLFAYVADAAAGLKVVQLTSPSSQPNFYGFSPEPKPELIASFRTSRPALSLSRPLERDRAVDESGGQVAVFGRRGSRPFTLSEMQRMYLDKAGQPWFVEDDPRSAEGTQ
jgi:hypothetical protein